MDGSTPEILTRIAGGKLVTSEAGGDGYQSNTFGTVNIEQVVEWDPEVIFMGRTVGTDKITKNDQWKEITAVKNGAVYETPHGVFYWDNSSEQILTIMYVASILHPELFTDLNMVEETKYFYKTFYNYNLTDEEAKKSQADRLASAIKGRE